MNVAFQLEALTNADGGREIVSVECEATTEEVTDELNAEETGAGAWEFQFVISEDFDGTEPVFKAFRRYGLTVSEVHEACAEAWESANRDAMNT